MWQRGIPIERRYGITRCTHARVFDRGLGPVLSMCGLSPQTDALTEVSRSQAQTVLEALLWKDLAHRAEVMSLQKARELAHEFVASLAEENTKYFVNADWSLYLRKPNGFSFTGLTDSTFDGGVVALSGGFAACVWVEDKD